MNQEDGNGRKQQDGKPGGQSVMLYIAIGAIGVTLLVMMFVKSTATVVSYQHLIELVDANQPGGSGVIEFKQPLNDSEELVRLSGLRDVKIGDGVVRGLVDIERPQAEKSKTNP